MRKLWSAAALSAVWLAGCQTAPPTSAGPLIDGPIPAKNARWAAHPDGPQLAAVYPAHAQHLHLGGQSRIRCQVLPSGKLIGCVLVSESPPGEGFGHAELQLAPFFQLAPANFGPNATVEVPVRWQLRN